MPYTDTRVVVPLATAQSYRTVIAFGDTQKLVYQGSQNLLDFEAMMDWIIANKYKENIDFVMHPGDCIDMGSALPLADPSDLIFGIFTLADCDQQWVNFNTQFARLEPSGSWDGIPYVICRGNHDNMGDAADIAAGLDTNGWPFYYPTSKFETLETAFTGRDRFFEHETDSPSGLSHVFRVKIGDTLVRVIAPTYFADDNETAWAVARAGEFQTIPAITLTHWWGGNPGVENDIVQPMATVAPQLFATMQGHTWNERIELDAIQQQLGDTIVRLTADFSETSGNQSWLARMRFYLNKNNVVVNIAADFYNPVTDQVQTILNTYITRQSFSITPPASTAPYDLYGTDTAGRGTIPFPVNWPTAPITSQVLEVPSGVSLATALATPGARINVAAGSYGTLALSQNDQHWVLDNNATFSSISTSGNPQRLIIEGGNIASSSSNFITATDMLWRNINYSNSDGSLQIGLAGTGAVRNAFIHCSMTNYRNGLLVIRSTNNVAIHQDLIFAACYIRGGVGMPPPSEAALRIMSTTRAIAVDCRLSSGDTAQGTFKNTLRSHYNNQDYWARNCLAEYGDGVQLIPSAGVALDAATMALGDHWIYDFQHYKGTDDPNTSGLHMLRTFNGGGSTDPASWTGSATIVGGRGYDHRQTDPEGVLNSRYVFNEVVGDTISDNIEFPYQAPPALNAWLAADGLPPGADH